MLKQLGVKVDLRTWPKTLEWRAELIAAVASLSELKSLRLDWAAMHPELGQLGSSLPNLMSLRLERQEWGECLPALGAFKISNLVSLSLDLVWSNSQLPRSPWSFLAAAAHLEHLVIDVECRHSLGKRMLQIVGQLTTLTHLKLGASSLTAGADEQATSTLSKLTRLASLSLGGLGRITPGTMNGILALTSLTELRFSRVQSDHITAEGVTCLTVLKNLAVLGLPESSELQYDELLRPLKNLQFDTGMRVMEFFTTGSS